MNTLNKINCEVLNLGITNNCKPYWYFYIIVLNGKLCAKCGKSSVNLQNRIYNYLAIEHYDKIKNWDSFKLITVMEFKKESSITHIEEFIKDHLRKYPLNVGQHHNIEQYDIVKLWSDIEFREIIESKKFPLAKVYSVDNPNELILKLIKDYPNNSINIPKNTINAIVPIKNVNNTIVPNENKHNIFGGKMDIDTAMLIQLNGLSYYELIEIPNIGPKMATAITEHKPFRHVSDLLSIHMIGPKRYQAIINHIEAKGFRYMMSLLKNNQLIN